MYHKFHDTANISIEIHNEKYYKNIDKKKKNLKFLDKINQKYS